MEKVKATEGNKDWKELNTANDFTTMIFFKDTVGGLEANVLFQFFEDKLCFVSISFTKKYRNNNDYITDYNRIDESLQNKYGSAKVEWDWSVDTFKDSIDMWGYALKEGHIHIYTEWGIPNVETPKTLIDHSIEGIDYDIFHGIRYHSLELTTQLESLREAENVF